VPLYITHLVDFHILCAVNHSVMPMEIFVSCVGDLATLEGPVLVVSPVCSPPGSFSFFVCEALGIRKFYPGSSFPF